MLSKRSIEYKLFDVILCIKNFDVAP
jgi:hypothetical protein